MATTTNPYVAINDAQQYVLVDPATGKQTPIDARQLSQYGGGQPAGWGGGPVGFGIAPGLTNLGYVKDGDVDGNVYRDTAGKTWLLPRGMEYGGNDEWGNAIGQATFVPINYSPEKLQTSLSGAAEASKQSQGGWLDNIAPLVIVGLGAAAGFGLLAGAGGWVSAEGGAGYLGGMAADASELAAAGTAAGDVGVDQVGSDWATGQATGPPGGLLNTTPEGLTAANTDAASVTSSTITGSTLGDSALKQAASTAVKGIIDSGQTADSEPDISASFGSLSGIDLPIGYKNLGPSYRGASNVRG